MDAIIEISTIYTHVNKVPFMKYRVFDDFATTNDLANNLDPGHLGKDERFVRTN